ncbi:hypothetical protein ACROYT_G032616 [Oculina patagonica]
MSLLRWKELAKSKSDLGDKINYVKNAITQNNIGQQTSQESLAKVFKPVTSKLDEVIESNLQIPKVPKKRVKKGLKGELEAPDYYPEVDPFEDMDVDNIFEPQQQKQIPKQPPRYSDVFEKEGPDYGTFSEDEGEIVEAESEEDADEDIEVEDESEDEITPEDFGLTSIDDVKTELVDKKNKIPYLKSIIAKATHERNRLKGFKSDNTKKFKAGKISSAEAKTISYQLDNSNKFLTAYINENKELLKTIQKKGSGIRRKHRGGYIMFFNDPKKLLKKLEIIIGSINAGNTSVEMRNMGVAILDTLLKRTSEYLQRYELVRFQLDDVIRAPANGQHQLKNGYKFTINDRSSFYDWYNAYFEVQFQVQLLADGATTGAERVTVINGAHSLINHIMIKSSGKIAYDTTNLHKVTFVKNLLEYSDDFSRSVAKNSLWYLDTSHLIANANQNAGFEARRLLTTGLNDVNVVIPLNRYSFFEELEGRMLLPMQLQFNIQLQNDDELIQKAVGVDDCRVVIDRFLLWVPKLTPKDSLYDKFVSSFLVKNTWTYSREMYEVSAPTHSSGFFQISSSIDNVKAIFVYLQRAKSNNADANPYEFDTYNINADRGNGSYLTTCRLEYGNGVFYPETEYDSESKVRIFNDLMSYGMRKNDYNSGTQLNLANYNSLYPIIFFDLSYQAERVTRDPKQLIFRYKLNANSAEDSAFNVHAIVLYNETIVIDKKKQTECIPESEQFVKAKNGRLMLKCKCVECGITKTKFVKSQSGGALARYKGPSTTDKIAYVASNFVTPSPSFGAMARLLAGQTFKGLKDNVNYYRKGKGVDVHKLIGKAVVIERFNKTLKNKMYKQFTVQGNTQYLDMLPKLIKEYNNTKHSSIKMSPTEASKKKNEGIVYFNLYGDMEQVSSKPKFKVGDKVRISKYKRIVFDKGYTPNWSEEIFKINKIQYTNPITYKLKDLRDEEIQGSFYEPELLKAKQDVFRIDKVIRRDYKKKQALVKWKGYSDDFNSWIPFKDLQQI